MNVNAIELCNLIISVLRHRTLKAEVFCQPAAVLSLQSLQSRLQQPAATCSRWFLTTEFFYPEDGGETFLPNIGSFHRIYTSPHPRRRHPSNKLKILFGYEYNTSMLTLVVLHHISSIVFSIDLADLRESYGKYYTLNMKQIDLILH
jgi:hypothetical protein